MEYVFYGYIIRTDHKESAERLKDFLENNVIHFSLTWKFGYYIFKITADEAESTEIDNFLRTDLIWKTELTEVED